MKKIVLVTILVLSCDFLFSAISSFEGIRPKSYFISKEGSDANTGSIESPWRSLNHAFREMKGGETIYFREGVYKMNCFLKDFTTSNGLPVIVKPYANEKVVFNGVRSLTPQWKHWKNGVYRTKVKQPFWELFVNGKHADMARWPNTSFDNDSIWRMTQSMRNIDGGFRKGKYTGKSRLGLVYDKGFDSGNAKGFYEGDSRYEGVLEMKSLSESNSDFTGAYAVLNIGNWLTFTREITAHKPGDDFFNYDISGIKKNQLKSHGAYYIYGLAALDKTGEWWYDKKTNYLYYKPQSEKALQQLEFELRDQDFALEFTNCEDIKIQDIDFFATGYFIKGSDRIEFRDCNFTYMSANKFVLGQTNWFTPFNSGSDSSNQASSIFSGSDCKFINCTVLNSNAPLYFVSNNITIENCSFEGIEWDVNTGGASGSILLGKNAKMIRNSLSKSGNSEGIRAQGGGANIRFNRVFDAGNLQHDGSGINIGTKDHINSIVEFNWVYDCNRQGIRFDYHGTNILNENKVPYGDGIVRNNVTWKTQPNQIKGDRHLILNNTVVSCNLYKNPFEEKFNMSIQGFKAMHDIESNAHSITRNNLAKLTHRSWNLVLKGSNTEYRVRKDGYILPKAQKLPGIHDHNTDEPGASYLYLRDPDNLDFRPKKGSSIVDAGARVHKEEIPSSAYQYTPVPFEGAAPDIGAYEYGTEYYWIPGRKLKTASFPIPQNKSVVKKDTDLKYLEALNAKSHVVYMGLSETGLKKQAELSNSNIYNPSSLVVGETYFWRVDALIGEEIVQGPVWSFTVGNNK